MLAFILVDFYCSKQTTFWWIIRRAWTIQNYMKDEKGQSHSEKDTFQRSNGHLGILVLP